MPSPGQAFGDYRIVSHLSDGGMASLFLGRHQHAAPEDPPVAIKVIHEHLSQDWQFTRMFVDEALISVRLRHPNVIRVDELGEVDGVYFLAMEYVHGCSLAELLRAMGLARRRMRPEIAVYIAAHVAAGLHAAHEMVGHDGQLLGIVHRDVSPQNILLSVDGSVKLLDFGIAKARGRAERTEAGVIKGKVRYMAPEQAAGEGVDRRVDVYALGVVLWESLTMRRYIEGKSDVEIIRRVRYPEPTPPSTRVAGIEPWVDQVVLSALAPDAALRPATAEALQHLLEGGLPPGAVGPEHISELLRVFVGDQIADAALALPEDVGRLYVHQIRKARPLPGEREGDEDTASRTRTLTIEIPAAAQAGGPVRAEDEPTRAPVRGPKIPTETVPDDPRPTMRDDGGFLASLPPGALPEFGLEEDEEHTVEASGHEMQDLMERMYGGRASAHDEAPMPATISRSNEVMPTRQGAAPPVGMPGPAAPSEEPQIASPWRWVLAVFVITLLAFVIGAGAAVTYVRYLR